MIQRWTGVVQEFDGTNVCALLEDETDPSNPREVAVIPLAKMYGYQRRLRRHVRPGAVFTWTIRVRYVKRGVKGRKEVATSEFRFSRKRWTRKDIKRIRREAKTTMKWLNAFWPVPGAGGNPAVEVKLEGEDQTCKSISAAAREWRFEQQSRRLGFWWTWNKEFRHPEHDGIRPQFVYKENTVIPSQEFPTNEAFVFPTPLKKDNQ